MARAIGTLFTAALAAAGVYLFDPLQGRRRRALLRDRYVSVRTRLERGGTAARRDAAHRLRGLAARLATNREYAAADDDTVVQRVRAALGRCVARPQAIRVEVRAGRVELAGDVLSEKHEPLLRTVLAVRGVSGVDDALTVHDSPQETAALGGVRPLRARRSGLLHRRWPPALRAAAGTTGLLLSAYGLARGRLLPFAAGAALLARSAYNLPLAEALSAKMRGAIRVQKTVRVEAEPAAVYAALSRYDAFPRFMHHVLAVDVRPDGVSHWTVAGPAGLNVEWDAVTTDKEENRLIAWATVEGSDVDHAGTVRLVPEGDATRVHVALSYTPPAGSAGRALAELFGVDPERELEEDLMRMKSFLERSGAKAGTPLLPA